MSGTASAWETTARSCCGHQHRLLNSVCYGQQCHHSWCSCILFTMVMTKAVFVMLLCVLPCSKSAVCSVEDLLALLTAHKQQVSKQQAPCLRYWLACIACSQPPGCST